MSRLFDALQEAARHRGTNGSAGEEAWAELGIGTAAVRKVEQDKTVSVREPETGAAVATEEVPAAPPNVTPLTPLPTNPAKIFLDRSARLIPHCDDPAVVERYRMLRTKILQEREKKSFRSLVIASASPQEGKTVTVLNLALSFAALPSFKILVIDGDMRKGTLGSWLGIENNHPGLSNLIEGSARLEEVLLKSEDLSLHVIPRGNTQIHDLRMDHFKDVFRPLSEHFDLILIDTPPVNLITDVQIIAASCDAVLLVARPFSTTIKSLEEAVQKLQSFRLIGTVLNAGAQRRSYRDSKYY